MIQRYGWFALVLLLSASSAFAQTDAAVATVKQYFAQSARYSAGDLENLVTTDAYTSRRSGATYVYLRQSYNGLEVVNATAQAAVARDGRLAAPVSRLVTDLASRVNTDTPSIFEFEAASQAEAHLRRTVADWKPAHTHRTVSDGPSDYLPVAPERIEPGYFALVEDTARLVYFVTDAGAVRLAWELELAARDQQHHFLMRVDAVDGRVLSQADYVSHDNWSPPVFQGGLMQQMAPAPVVQAVAPARSIVEVASASNIGTYRVFAMPVESPSHGPHTLVMDPDDATASPLGWHDTGSTSYTLTRGNNVSAYQDADNDGNPEPGEQPDGGGSLIFDFPYLPGQDPALMKDAAVTNLFYWNNIIHDVLYHYGFDEPAGNFQVNNFGNGGLGNDDVRAEAQDGGGLNNANFFTPTDGQRPRMQMYLWNGPSPLTISAPVDIAGVYTSLVAAFGPQTVGPGDFQGDLVLVDDGSAEGQRGCNALVNGPEIAGNIAIIERGDCEFGVKVLNAEQAGAVGAIVFNCDPAICTTSTTPGENVMTMGAGAQGGNVTIPSFFVARSTGLTFVSRLPGVIVGDAIAPGIPFDGDFDNGIITHEYGHGISNRLTGGPSATGCLSNDEQMGEGWSDYYGMMLTMETGDMGTDPRGVGTWVSIQPTDGTGIRPAPYSTDFAINGFTYQDSRTQAVPHGVGFVFASALWEATWELIDVHGFDPDFYNATGTAGNQIMLQLVTEGMKLQPCSPGFVDGRDAILEADQLLYGGAHTDLLWAAFARRGLGAYASQGLSSTNADNTEDFSLPTDPPPVAAVDPQTFSFALRPGESEQTSMTIQNTGAAPLIWTMGSRPSWLSASPTSGTVAAGATATVNFTANAGALPVNTYNAVVVLNTNAPADPTINLDFSLEVLDTTASEGGLEFPGTHLLSEVYPNPFNPQATFSLAVAEAQAVRIELYDALGRRVALLHEGALSGRTRHTFTVDGSQLTSGTYFVRIAGEAFAEMRRITLLK